MTERRPSSILGGGSEAELVFAQELESLRAEAVGDALFRRDPGGNGMVLFDIDGTDELRTTGVDVRLSVISQVADRLHEEVRPGDRAFWYGSDEFVAFIGGARAEVLAEADRLRAALGSADYEARARSQNAVVNLSVSVTVSGGVVHASETPDIIEAVALAHARVGSAKERGRNCVHADGTPAASWKTTHIAEPDLEAVTELAARRGRTVASLLREAVELLITHYAARALSDRRGDAVSALSEPADAEDEHAVDGETPERNLRRIFADGLRVAAGEARLDATLAAAGPAAPFVVLLVDLDSSAAVRARGIGAKIDIVRQMQRLVAAELQEDEWLIDSGTRDEVFVVMPRADPKEACRAGERVRARVAKHPFVLGDGTPVALTCSVGVAGGAPEMRSGFDLMWMARKALAEAKRTRNAVALFTGVQLVPVELPLIVEQADRLRRLAVELDRSEQSLLNEALLRLFDRHKGVWYWGVEQWEPFAALVAV